VAPVRSVTYINYAQPIIVQPAPVVVNAPIEPQTTYSPTGQKQTFAPEDQTPTLANSEPVEEELSAQDKALDMFDTARGLFKRGDYPLALSQADRAISQLPNDPLMHEFRALCLFAMKDYSQAAAATYAVLSVGPGWDRSTLEGLYNNMAVYTAQLNALEAYSSQHPDAGDAHFLLAYHYMLNDRNQEATKELQAALQLEPKNRLASQLLKGLSSSAQEAEQGPELAAPATPTTPVDAAKLPGKWTAERSDGAKIELSMTGDHKFTWTVASEDKPQSLTGTYSFADNYLILSSPGQNALVGQVAMPAPDQLTFKLAGGSPQDPGLTFAR
jgi:tetratricopeptide (TPR) repeat protein